MIEVRSLEHVFLTRGGGELPALQGIDLDVEQGEFLAIVGHNGSGKSTLARHFNALLLPTRGSVRVEGLDTADPENLWTIRQKVGMVFQNPDNQLVATTVEEDVAFGPENLGVPQPVLRARVDEALAAVGMSEFAHLEPHRLSGGQKQRVAIAGVIAMRPRCLVLDEPTAMLDPVGRREVLATVRRLNQEEGITVIYITHFMEEAVRADRVLVMEQGRVALQGTPRQVFSQVERMKALHLDVPPVTELAHRLAGRGWAVPTDVLTAQELAAALLQVVGGQAAPAQPEAGTERASHAYH
ncbi:MAG: energy-coupling factor transporter ATPase [Firmicutes bacterium]|nr:energy-coupling factor transporter ATPase [Bacillota bacterium]